MQKLLLHIQVCRLAYEVMQTYHVDASRNYYSLDDIYYFGGQQEHDVKAIQSHTARDSSMRWGITYHGAQMCLPLCITVEPL